MIATATLIKNASEGIVMSRPLLQMAKDLPDGKYRVVLEPQTKMHTVPQRRLFFMWLSYLSRHTGIPKKAWYVFFCRRFLTEDVEGVSKMTSCQLTHFMCEVESDVAAELGITLPTPEDGEIYQCFIREYKDK